MKGILLAVGLSLLFAAAVLALVPLAVAGLRIK